MSSDEPSRARPSSANYKDAISGARVESGGRSAASPPSTTSNAGDDEQLSGTGESSRMRKSCDYCVRMKRACDGKTPCELCTRRKKECTRSVKKKSGPAKGTKYAARRPRLPEEPASSSATATTTPLPMLNQGSGSSSAAAAATDGRHQQLHSPYQRSPFPSDESGLSLGAGSGFTGAAGGGAVGGMTADDEYLTRYHQQITGGGVGGVNSPGVMQDPSLLSGMGDLEAIPGQSLPPHAAALYGESMGKGAESWRWGAGAIPASSHGMGLAATHGGGKEEDEKGGGEESDRALQQQLLLHSAQQVQFSQQQHRGGVDSGDQPYYFPQALQQQQRQQQRGHGAHQSDLLPLGEGGSAAGVGYGGGVGGSHLSQMQQMHQQQHQAWQLQRMQLQQQQQMQQQALGEPGGGHHQFLTPGVTGATETGGAASSAAAAAAAAAAMSSLGLNDHNLGWEEAGGGRGGMEWGGAGMHAMQGSLQQHQHQQYQQQQPFAGMRSIAGGAWPQGSGFLSAAEDEEEEEED